MIVSVRKWNGRFRRVPAFHRLARVSRGQPAERSFNDVIKRSPERSLTKTPPSAPEARATIPSQKDTANFEPIKTSYPGPPRILRIASRLRTTEKSSIQLSGPRFAPISNIVFQTAPLATGDCGSPCQALTKSAHAPRDFKVAFVRQACLLASPKRRAKSRSRAVDFCLGRLNQLLESTVPFRLP